MRTREMSLAHYGITNTKRKILLNMVREKENYDLVRIASRQSNGNLEDLLFVSLTEGRGYDFLSKRNFIYIGKDDFYGYWRRALCLFSMLLMCRDDGYLVTQTPETKT